MKRAFGELELTILNILKLGSRMTVKEIQQCLGDHDKYTTIMTVMNRLVEKKQLVREKMGHHYEYWLEEPKKVTVSLLEQFKKKLFSLKSAEMISYLIASADDISDAELSAMERLIQKEKENRKKS